MQGDQRKHETIGVPYLNINKFCNSSAKEKIGNRFELFLHMIMWYEMIVSLVLVIEHHAWL